MAFEKIKLKTSIFIINIISWPLAFLPHKLGLGIGAFIGHLLFQLLARRRKVAVANVKMVQQAGGLPADLDPYAVAKESFANLGRSGWESLKIYHRGFESMLHLCAVDGGEEYMEQKRPKDQGLVIVTGHCGNWELMCHLIGRICGKMHIVGRSLGTPLADAMVKQLRRSDGNDFIFKTGGAKNMLQVLKKGEILGTLIDQAAIVNHEGVSVPFLGLPAMTNIGPLKLALRTKSKVLLVLFHREGEKHLATFYPPLSINESIDPNEAVLEAATILNNELSSFIQRHPTQWLWGHRRWKTPQGVAADPHSIT